jgi:hypothetical protein
MPHPILHVCCLEESSRKGFAASQTFTKLMFCAQALQWVSAADNSVGAAGADATTATSDLSVKDVTKRKNEVP